jgi:hypothetical protein
MTDSENELAALQARVAELEARAKPPKPFTPEPYQRFDPTAGMSMPRSAMEAMVNAVDDRTMRDLAAHGTIPGPSAAGAGSTISSHSDPGLPGSHRGNGWRPETPFGPQPGINHVDRLVDAQDAKDRAELIAEHARTAAVRKALSESK